MRYSRKLVALVVAVILVLSLFLVPVVSRVSPARADVTWTRYSGEVTLDSQLYVADAWVIKDGATYRMWYTRVKTDLTAAGIVDSIIAAANVTASDNIVAYMENGQPAQFLGHLGIVDADKITDLLDGSSTVIGYATSTNGRDWAVVDDEVLAGSGAAWNSVGAPCVIKDDDTYRMWYTRVKSNVALPDDLWNILDRMGQTGSRTQALKDLLDGVSTVIGYATSGNGTDWTVVDDEVLAGSGEAWHSVGDPCVIKDDGTYRMWYTRVKSNVTKDDLDTLDAVHFTIGDLWGILDGVSTVIAYATGNGTDWTVVNSEVLAGNGGIWHSVADPCVLESGSSYEMWYTRGTSDFTQPTLRDLKDGIAGLVNQCWDILGAFVAGDLGALLDELGALDIVTIRGLLGGTNTVIAYATGNGTAWTVQDTQDLVGSSNNLWSSVAAPSVIKCSDEYKMWYTEGIGSLNLADLLTLVLGDDLPIGYAYYTPPAAEEPGVGGGGGGGGGLPAAEDIGEMSAGDAADELEGMTDVDAADILEETDTDKAADILEELDADNAADILEETDTDKAADILEETDTDKAADILEETDADKAAAVMEKVSTDKLTDLIQSPNMSEQALTDRLPGLSPDKLYSIDPQVLFDALPNAPTAQLSSEDPPEPPAAATAPIVVYTTPSGARYIAIQTWAGKWVVVSATPMPVDKLLIKTKRALINVRTTMEIFEEQPLEVAVGLPAGQIVRAYIAITFENAAPEDIELGHMTFKVETEWLEENSIHKWSVFLNRYDPELEQWIALPTKRVKEDRLYVYYTAPITRFSIFAISGSQALPSLNFEATNLIIDPVKAETGEAITISADITNLSDEALTYVATLWIDNIVETGQDIYLKAGETKPVSFTVTRDAEGSYQVRLDRLLGSFNVTKAIEAPAPAPAAFVASALSITPAEVNIGEEVTISVLISNSGDLEGTYPVILKIDNVVVATKEVTLAGGASEEVSFTTTKDVAGTYAVAVDGLSGTLTFVVEVPPPRPINWWMLGGIIAACIAVALVISLTVARRRRRA